MWPLFQVPDKYKGPSGEPGQILLKGRAAKVTAFHGWVRDDADWHVYLDLPAETSADLRAATSAQQAGTLTQMYCEVMVLDAWDQPSFIGDDRFYSADVSRAFRLTKPGSSQTAWDLMLQAANSQGNNLDFSAMSTLIGGTVWLQGPFVNDTRKKNGFQPEIHPLDSIAFAMDSAGRTVTSFPGEPSWPSGSITWRVAWFANSRIHDINDESYLRKERTTAWLLPPPTGASLPGGSVEVTETKLELLDVPRRARYVSRGVAAGPTWELVASSTGIGPALGPKATLNVVATMKEPNKYGGLVVRDYKIVHRQPGNQL